MSENPRLEVSLELHRPRIRVGDSCPVSVRLRNGGSDPVIVNRRLAVGYTDSLSREVFIDILDPSGGTAEVDRVDYDRDFSAPDDYVELAPGTELTGTFDLTEWYPIREPGSYRLVAHYQADESLASPPPGTAGGVFSSEPAELTVTDG